jgi:hypothetical protein
MDAAIFFAQVRMALFGGAMSQPQVDGLDVLLTAGGALPLQQLAYVLATAFHETARTMQPIAEYGHGAGKPYGKVDQTGKAPYGRGYVQLTWRANYLRADAALGLGGRLAADYDLALEPDIAARIILRGMSEGWFTGKTLADYIAGGRADYIGARAIVNGHDRAELIAGYAAHFEFALRAAGWPS